jgi:hypothetical protein
MGRETGSLHLLAPLLLMGGKGADLVIRGNVVLNRNHHPSLSLSYLLSLLPHDVHSHFSLPDACNRHCPYHLVVADPSAQMQSPSRCGSYRWPDTVAS